MSQTESMEPAPVEPLSEKVARRLRGCLAENRISGTDLARALHMPQQKVSRKVNGQTPLTLDELALLAEVLEVQLDVLMGTGEWSDRPIGRVALRGSQAATGGGTMFLPLDLDRSAPSGTRTPNPLIRGVEPVADLGDRRNRLNERRPGRVTERRLRLVGEAS